MRQLTHCHNLPLLFKGDTKWSQRARANTQHISTQYACSVMEPNLPKPLCTAAHTAVLIDADKTVRPCCAYSGTDIKGSLGIAKLGEIDLAGALATESWQTVRKKLAAGTVPAGCAMCIRREHQIGNSQRMVMEQRESPNWQAGITYFELNSSNLCNLQCRHCSPLFSSRWSAHGKKHGWKDVSPIVPPDGALLQRSLDSVDLSHLEFVSLKGGEPMLNSDVLTLLEHLAKIDVLPRVTVSMVTNGTVIDEQILTLLRAARQVEVCFSVDGFGPVQTYIRHGGSHIEKIEKAARRYAAEPNFTISRNTSVMIYNVFSLDRIDAWWNTLAAEFPGKFHHRYGLFVLWPEHLSVSCLQDKTRRQLRAKYEALDAKLYHPVLRALSLPYAGDAMHDQFVRSTQKTDLELGRKVLDAVPELAEEMRLLEPAIHSEDEAKRRQQQQGSVMQAQVAAIWTAIEAGDLATAGQLADGCAPSLPHLPPGTQRAAMLHAQGVVAGMRGAFDHAERMLSEAANLMPDNAGILAHLQRARTALAGS
jgi:MoaA/NifB/PqqE/SkfB family radical SAM enzyme